MFELTIVSIVFPDLDTIRLVIFFFSFLSLLACKLSKKENFFLILFSKNS